MMKGEPKYRFKPDYAVPPGKTLQAIMQTQGIGLIELANETGLLMAKIEAILAGKAPITPEIAIALEIGTAVPALMWNRLEKNYRAQLAANGP